LSYKIEVYKDENLVYGQDFNNVNNIAFVPQEIGEYVVRANVKDELQPENVLSYELKFNVVKEPVSRGSLFQLKKGMKDEKIKTLQGALNSLLYNLGTPTGYFGDKTYNAVVDYQKKKGLKVTGVVDDVLYSMILMDAKTFDGLKLSYKRILKLNVNGDDVKRLQNALNRLGYSVQINGIFDAKTAALVKKLQKDNRMAADGIVGKAVVNKINVLLVEKIKREKATLEKLGFKI
ncbi:MAG: peptidoglycan-binding protein, partial [Caloramator sp.]|nr:peptidoglycan-binding protein [Caloramator sp.]